MYRVYMKYTCRDSPCQLNYRSPQSGLILTVIHSRIDSQEAPA